MLLNVGIPMRRQRNRAACSELMNVPVAAAGGTTVYVAHDQVEALTMGDRVAVMKDGVLQQVGTPKDVYAKSADAFVGGFIGSPAMNQFTVPFTDQACAPATPRRAQPRDAGRVRAARAGGRPRRPPGAPGGSGGW
jgi:multiple sugar transport system ATP-binding protein